MKHVVLLVVWLVVCFCVNAGGNAHAFDFGLKQAAPSADTDADGLPDRAEAAARTNPRVADTDGDGLSDYAEARKYRTDPLRADSDGDGAPDGDWNERREWTYTIQAIVDLRPPFDLAAMNDSYQDARVLEAAPERPSRAESLVVLAVNDFGLDRQSLREFEERRREATRVEVVLYPEAEAILNPAAYRPTGGAWTRPTYAKNYSAAMQAAIRRMVAGAKTDADAVGRILKEMARMKYVALDKDLGYGSDLPLQYHVHRTAGGRIVERPYAATTRYGLEAIKARVFFADSMFRLRTHETCGSVATLRGAMLRAAGLPERTVLTIPLVYSYESDGTRIDLRRKYRVGPTDLPYRDVAVYSHMFNEVRIGNQWVRVDDAIGENVIAYGRTLSVKLFACHDLTDVDLTKYWNYDTWRERRPYRYVSVIEQDAKHRR